MEFKSDTEYGIQIELTPDRDLPIGHKGFNLDETDTEVTALQKILDKYIDTSSSEAMLEFNDHKVDFSVVFIDSIVKICEIKCAEMESVFDEVNKQIDAINHRILKPYVDGKALTIENKMEIYDMYEELLIQRRRLKDSIAALKVFIDNSKKSRNYILGMNQRKYTPKTDKFKNDADYQLGKEPKELIIETPTKVTLANGI